MTPAEAKRLVVMGTVGAGTLTAVATLRKGGQVTPRLAVGVFVAGTMLAVGAEVAPGIAGGFAVLMLTTAAFVLGGDAWAGISEATSSTSAARKAPTSTPGQLGPAVGTSTPIGASAGVK